MATYVIGDVQGCAFALEALLETLAPSDQDRIWFAGDLVNRGGHSLRTLNLVQSLQATTVLGNHDLHLLARSFGYGHEKGKDTLDDCLRHPEQWRDWLLQQPLVFHDGFTLVHAGLYWPADTSLDYAQDAKASIERDPEAFFNVMYGNEPESFSTELEGQDFNRFVVNTCTRMRVLNGDRLNLKYKSTVADRPKPTQPWYSRHDFSKVVFGHWAALETLEPRPTVYATDTGCVWGQSLSAICLDTGVWTQQPALEKDRV